MVIDDSDKKEVKKLSTKRKPTLTQILDFYDIYLAEQNIKGTAITLGISRLHLIHCLQEWPLLRKVRKRADAKIAATKVGDYIYKHLSKEAREIWEEIQFHEGRRNGESKIAQIIGSHPKEIRQELFLHALISTGYDISEACRLTSISRNQILKWDREDPNFHQLSEEINWHKKNFFEKALVSLVESGHPMAVLMVNRTVNADRGYNEKLTLKHEQAPQQQLTTGINIDELDLDIDTRRKILEAVRKKQNPPPLKNVLPMPASHQLIDAEVITEEKEMV